MSNSSAERRCFHWETSEHHRELFWPDLGCPYCEITRLRKELDDLRSQQDLPDSIKEALNSGDGTYRP